MHCGAAVCDDRSCSSSALPRDTFSLCVYVRASVRVHTCARVRTERWERWHDSKVTK